MKPGKESWWRLQAFFKCTVYRKPAPVRARLNYDVCHSPSCWLESEGNSKRLARSFCIKSLSHAFTDVRYHVGLKQRGGADGPLIWFCTPVLRLFYRSCSGGESFHQRS